MSLRIGRVLTTRKAIVRGVADTAQVCAWTHLNRYWVSQCPGSVMRSDVSPEQPLRMSENVSPGLPVFVNAGVQRQASRASKRARGQVAVWLREQNNRVLCAPYSGYAPISSG